MTADVYIVGGGPSLKGFDWNLLKGKYVIAINRSYEVLPEAQIVYFTDKQFWELHKEKLLKHKGKKIKGSIGNTWINHPDVQEYTLTSQNGLETAPGHLRHGYNSTYAAINLAYLLGYKRIFLLGIDMAWGTPGKKSTSHWHTGHPRVDNESAYKNMLKSYSSLVQPLKEKGIELININPKNSLPMFQRVDFKDIFGDNGTPKVVEENLLGDKVEQVLKVVGAAKVAQVYQRITKKPCNCGKRREQLNNFHRNVLHRSVVPPRIEPVQHSRKK